MLCCAVLTIACAKRLPRHTIAIQTNSGAAVSLIVEIARTETERERGFMERTNIPDGTGMLFIFERDQILSFWMKDTPTPLSIAYIDARGTIRSIHDMTPYSRAPIESRTRVRYALEVPQGWFSRAGISVGDVVAIP